MKAANAAFIDENFYLLSSILELLFALTNLSLSKVTFDMSVKKLPL